jgi:hypothetical protein
MVAVTAAGVAVLNTQVKYFNARGDPPLPDMRQPSEAPAANKTQEG